MKHTTAWTPTEATKDEPPGWTSPTGRRYPSEHQDWEPPQWPRQILDRLARLEPDPALPDGRPPDEALPEDALPQDALPEGTLRDEALIERSFAELQATT